MKRLDIEDGMPSHKKRFGKIGVEVIVRISVLSFNRQ
jgi:hypothetical protein